MNGDHTERLVMRLSQFMHPAAFLGIVRQESKPIPDDRFFNAPDCKPLREAWAAGHFALGLDQVYSPVDVRLDHDCFPDFHLRVCGIEYEFELTVAGKPERKIGREYKGRTSNPYQLMPYQPAKGQQEGPSWIAEALRKKHEKNYSKAPHILVYANFEAGTLDPISLVVSCHQWSSSFSSIWILWNCHYLLLYDSDAFGKADHVWHSCVDR